MNTKVKDYKRTIQYIDPIIQRKIIVGLILFELVLVGAGLVYLHSAFNEIIELRLFSIHPANLGDGSLLTKEVLIVSAVIFLVNIPIILLVVSIWADNLRGILRPYSRAMYNLEILDFRKSKFSKSKHPLANAIHKFFKKYNDRHVEIVEHIKTLDHSFSYVEKPYDEHSVKRQVDELLSILEKK